MDVSVLSACGVYGGQCWVSTSVEQKTQRIMVVDDGRVVQAVTDGRCPVTACARPPGRR